MVAMGRFVIVDPPPHLRALVRRLWFVEDTGRVGRELKLPTLEWQLLVSLDGAGLSARDDRGEWTATSGVALAHVSRRAVELDRGEQRRLAGVVLAPGALPLLLGIPAEALTTPLIDLDDLHNGGKIRQCERDPEDVFADLVSWLQPQSDAQPEPGLGAALRMLAAGHAVTDVADRLGRSESGLLRMFRRDVGMPPKQAQRLMRLGRAARALHRRDDPAVVAAEYGFADQAHLTHDFNELTGLTPGQYRLLATGDAMHVPQVA
jgi:AraC-like DNA-binding protein